MGTEPIAPRLIYTDLGLDVTGDHDDVFVINPDTLSLSDADREILETADSFGSFGPDAAAIVRRVGVPLADLWAAYRRERNYGDGAGDQDYDNAHRCDDCGVTGGGVVGGVCQDCDGERQRNGGQS